MTLLRMFALAMLGALTLAGAARAQISQNGPYYAQPSWDQQLPASSRWIVLTNWGSAAVLDRETGLVWERAAGGNVSNWAEDLLICLQRSTGGRSGWRLPSAEELMTLMDPATGQLFAGAPFTVANPNFPTRIFMSATTDPANTANALAVDFTGTASSLASGPKLNEQLYWCVRGYQGTQSPQ